METLAADRAILDAFDEALCILNQLARCGR